MRSARSTIHGPSTSRTRSGFGLALGLLCSAAVLGAAQSEADLVGPHPDTGSARQLLTHFDRLVPGALEATGVPGAAVGLITDGEITALRGYGFADIARERPVTRETVFNVGSVSKVAAAWAAMRLVAEGRLDLDQPVGAYLANWPLPDSPFEEDKITLRRLLSHTAGLSMDVVPEYEPDGPVPSAAEALGHPENGVRIASDPGTAWRYSGGGYMLLQLLIEEITGQPFDAYVRKAVFEPLGMGASAFSWTPALRESAATPYDEGLPVEYFRYAGQAAASLNTTIADLARFAAAGLEGDSGGGSPHRPGRDILSPEEIAIMQSPAPATEQQWGVRSGLGYQVWGLHDRWAVDDSHPRMVGHAGQNTGWASILWIVPETGDGLVVLTNASDGRELWRWILCDWAGWINGTTYLGLCTDRPAALPPAPGEREARHPLLDSLVEAHLRGVTGASAEIRDAPGAAVLVARQGRVVHRTADGRADLVSDRALSPADAFYLASLAKPFTALAVTLLVADGKLALDDAVAEHFPELPDPAGPVTVAQLLGHTSGLPDYYGALDWARLERLTNDDVIEILGDVSALDFEPGSRFDYSNSNYVLLSALVERVTGQSLGRFLAARVFDPLGMTSTVLYETEGQDLPSRAVGYARRDDGAYRVSDYLSVQLPNGRTVPFRSTTTGGGGAFSTVDDLHTWTQALFAGRIVGRDAFDTVLAGSRVWVDEADALGLAGCGYGGGWYVCERYGETVYWHDGNWGGFSTMLLHAPGQDLTVVALSNFAGGSSASLGLEIADCLLTRPADAQSLPEFLAGDLTFRGDAWPVELTTRAGTADGRAVSADIDEATEAAQPETRLTLPDLVYADEPVETRREGDALVVTFPFGLGDYALESEAGSYVARVALGADTAALRLRPAEPPVVRRPVRFESAGASLGGTLHLPATVGPHPAVVVVQGSGEMGRSTWAYRSWGDAFARRGVAALVYDKRGVGESTGDFRRDSAFVAIAADAQAAVAYLRTVPEINSTRVGLAGWSQGGWVQLRAAAEDDSVAFLIMLSPAAFTPAQQEMQSVEARMRRAGFTEAEIADALAYTRLYFYVAATGRGWSRLEAETARLPDVSWAEHVQWPETPEDLAWWRRHMQVEPALYVPQIDAPVIAFFGGADPVVPAPANAGRMRELLAARPDSDFSVLTAPGADHRLEVSAGPDAAGQWRFPRISPLVLDSLDRWLDDQVLRGSGGR